MTNDNIPPQEPNTTEQVDNPIVPNPTGTGGFGDNPENINAGGRPKNQESFTYWMNYFKSMTTSEFKQWEKNTPEKDRTVAASLAFVRVHNARTELNEFKEVADRTEGKAPQTMIHTGGFFTKTKLKIEVVNASQIEPEAEPSDTTS